MNYNDFPTRFETVTAPSDNHFTPSGRNLSLVNTCNGELYNVCLDSVYKGVIPLNLTRLFRGGSEAKGRYGRGWSSEYDVRLEVDGPISIFHDCVGRVLVFEQEDDGTYRSIDLPRWSIREDAGKYLLKIDNTRETAFNAQGLPVSWRLLAADYRQSFDYEKDLLKRISDNHGRRMEFQYDTSRRVSRLAVYPTNKGGAARVVDYGYTENEELAQVKYDGWSIGYSYRNGQLASIEEPGGRVLDFEYDSKNRVSRSFYVGNAYDRSFHFNEKQRVTTVEETGGAKRIYSFNVRGLITRFEDVSGSSWVYAWNKASQLSAVTDSFGNKLQLSYDESGRPVAASDQTGWKRTLRYNAQDLLSEILDAYGHATQLTYDDSGRLSKIEDPLRGALQVDTAPNGLSKALQMPNGFTYYVERDDRGNVIKRWNSAGQEFQFTYDGFNNLTELRRPDGRSVQCGWDKNGLMTSERRGRGKATKFSYSPEGRLVEVVAGQVRTHYSYTDLGRISETLTEAANNKGEISHRAVIGYEYDATGELVRLQSGGYDVRYLFDQTRTQLQIVTQDKAVTIKGFPAKNLVKIGFPNGMRRELRYNDAGQIDRLVDYAGTRTAGRLTYTYNSMQQVASCKTLEGKSTYAYDELGRVVSSIFSGNGDARDERFEYDSFGNIVKYQSSAGEFALQYEKGVLLVSDGEADYSYDKVGRLVKVMRHDGGELSFSYDDFDRLIKVEAQEAKSERHQVEYIYDYRGARIGKIVDGQESWLIYERNNLLYETDAQGKINNRYVYGLHVDEPYLLFVGKNLYCYHSDRLGNVLALSDEKGSFLNRYEYGVFGQLQSVTERIAQPFAFQAREYETVSGIQYHRNRFYLPESFRFLTPDPSGWQGGWHPYCFPEDDPLNITDPWGLGSGAPVPTPASAGATTFDRVAAVVIGSTSLVIQIYFPVYRLAALASGVAGLIWGVFPEWNDGFDSSPSSPTGDPIATPGGPIPVPHPIPTPFP